MDSRLLAELAAEACEDRKAVDIELIDISKVSTLADWILVTEGKSDVQVRAISKSVEDKLEKEAMIIPRRKEGIQEGKWALLDYGDIIINIFRTEERNYYELELFWSNGKSYKYNSDK
tara:strand:- start:510 stop:863 length:354 start_codon:yes stop_codon:yes gene_type:complete